MVKEAKAIAAVLRAVGPGIDNTRVDARVDNKAVIGAWQAQHARSQELSAALKEIFIITCQKNINLRMQYVPSADNPADAPSRCLTKADAQLAPRCWARVQDTWGEKEGHTVDLMALDSNAMIGRDGQSLRHFTPWPTPNSAGVNLFAQTVLPGENCYVFPTIQLIPEVINFIREEGLTCTIVLPCLVPTPA